MRKVLLTLILTVAPALAQNGDNPGEVQAPPPAHLKIPPAPPLSVAEALKSFRIQPGYKIEIVAAEPLIEAPVAMAWHPNGNLFVVEMRNYMPDVDGHGETNHTGRVSVLQDTDGDGVMDKATVFLDNLNMPRAVAVVSDGVLVGVPPNLYFCRDTNGDLVADEKTVIASDYGRQGSPEHTANGLVWGFDNWIYSADHNKRYRRNKGAWEEDLTAERSGRGQWGISQDDFGRLFFNANSDYLRGELVPADLLQRNKNNRSPFGANAQLDKNQATFPARVTPGVNRGYQKGTLREDGTLARFTAACAPVIYRGDQFDATLYGAAFVCEPAANFVRASLLTETNGVISGANAFEKSEFLASMDERFRPVNIANGPDGALYIVDMYRGHLQHRIFVTSYLRKQIIERGLDNPDNMGRIYRVAQDGRARRKIEALSTNTTELVAALQHANGWHRETAQRLLVESNDRAAIEPLKKIAASNADGPAATHALWSLHGLGALDREIVARALASKNAKTRATAARIAGDIAMNDSDMRDALVKVAGDSEALVQLHALLSLGPISGNENVAEAMARLLKAHADEPLFRDAALSGLGGQEIIFLGALFKNAGWQEPAPGLTKIVASFARAIAVSRDDSSILKLFELAAAEKPWRREALLEGFASSVPPAPRNRPAPPIKPIELKVEPLGLLALRKLDLGDRLVSIEQMLAWPSKTNVVRAAAAVPLNEKEQALFNEGKQLYALTCGACHMPHGLGQEGLAPPLAESEWVTGSPDRLTRIALHGLRGAITVLGKQYSMEMAPLGVLEDEQLAQVLTYVRREWGHTASAVTPEFVAKVRAATASREEPWTEADLLKVE